VRSPAEMDILVIDLINRCFLKCSNCTRDIAHQTHTSEMTPDTFRVALASLRGWWKPGRVIGLNGGEPTLNRHFEEICRIFREEFNPGMTTHGRQPIGDFNRFATERLFDRTNGKGLWTSFGPKFTDYYEVVMDTFSHWNSNDHSTGKGVHQTSLVDAREMCAALGIDWSQWPALRDACWLQNMWSGSITPGGKAYFCERAAQLDLLYNDGKLGWDVASEPNWWKRRTDQFGEQLSICEMCSMALPGPGQVDQLDRDIIGKAHVERLIQIGSPVLKRGNYETFDPAKHVERRRIEQKDNYVGPSGVRVDPHNKYVYGKRVSCVVVSVGRSHHLAMTLPWNAKQVDEMIVVTSSGDTRTQEIVRESGGGVRLVISDRCYDDNHAFNKGRMINDGLQAVTQMDWVVLTDADVLLNPRFKQWMDLHAINPGVLYGTHRLDVPEELIPQLGTLRFEQNATGINAEPNGYFQLFNRRAIAIRDRGKAIMSEAFCSAGGVDSWFLQQFPKDKRHVVVELAVVHIQHGNQFGGGWNDAARRDLPSWRQCGLLSAQQFLPTENPPAGPLRLRLTDTRDGRAWEGNVGADHRLPQDVVASDGNGGLIFCGQPIGTHHIHVAWWDERIG
jgi:hypothetical protein